MKNKEKNVCSFVEGRARRLKLFWLFFYVRSKGCHFFGAFENKKRISPRKIIQNIPIGLLWNKREEIQCTENNYFNFCLLFWSNHTNMMAQPPGPVNRLISNKTEEMRTEIRKKKLDDYLTAKRMMTSTTDAIEMVDTLVPIIFFSRQP